METGSLPTTAGSAVEYDYDTFGNGLYATLAPSTWNPRTRRFDDLIWSAPDFTGNSSDVREVWPIPIKRLRLARVVHVGPNPTTTRRTPLRRLGTIALLDNVVYTYCAKWRRDDHVKYAAWLNPATGIATENIERYGSELVAGLP